MDPRHALQRVFPDLDAALIEALLARLTPMAVAAGEVLFHEGAVGDDALILGSGRLLVLTTDGEGRLLTLATVEQVGALVGEQALLDATARRNATVLAAVDGTVLRIPGDAFRLALGQSADGQRQLEAIGAAQARVKLDALTGLLGADTEQSRRAAPARLRLAAGAVLFAAGSPPLEAFAVVSGRLAVREPRTARLLYELGPGELVGRESVLEGVAHACSVAATRDAELLRLPAEEVRALARQSEALGSSVHEPWVAHALPGIGTCFRYSAIVDQQRCQTTDYTLPDGRRVVVRHFAASGLVAALASWSLPDDLQFAWGGGKATFRITRSNRTLAGVSAPPDWPSLGSVLQALLAGEPIEQWQQDGLEGEGVFLRPTAPGRGAQAIVCGCTNLSAAALEKHRASGVTGLEALGRSTGAGTVCGGCRGRLSAILSQASLLLCTLEGHRLCGEIMEFSLTPVRGSLPACRPGEHVLIEGLVEETWTGRPYTVTFASAAQYRIAVKREPDGEFSRWLFEAKPGELVRMAPPAGSITPAASDPRPLVYAVGGIGVTPAIAGCRSLAGRRALHVVYSFRSADEAAYLEELRAMAQAGAITLREVETSVVGRRAPQELCALLATLAAAELVVCGPGPFNRLVTDAVAGYPAVAVHVESFSDEGFQDLLAVQTTPGAWRQPGFQPRHAGGAEPVEVGAAVEPAEEARRMVCAMLAETAPEADPAPRVEAVAREFAARGTWTQTPEELAWAARVAWRNSIRCVGRMYWPGLEVRDLRETTHPDDIATALIDHLRSAFNGGDLRPIISIFAAERPGEPSARLWNPQLIRYASYPARRGRRRGDPGNAALTRRIEALGWTGAGGDFDILPLVIEAPGFGPRLYELPADATAEVPIRHPEHPWLETLGLRWYAVPAVSELALEAGAVRYRLAPFNGWYMGTEIAARNFTDASRYDLLPEIGRRMRLDQSSERTLWRDAAMVMLNQAVLHSFDASGIKMADHHATTREFLQFCRAEQGAGREPCGEWSWLVPPISGSATPLFLEAFEPRALKPAFVVQGD